MGALFQVFLAGFLVVVFLVPWDKANNEMADAAQLSQIKENIEIIEAAKDSTDPLIKEEAAVAKENLAKIKEERAALKELEKQKEIDKKRLAEAPKQAENQTVDLLWSIGMVVFFLVITFIAMTIIKRRREM